MRNFGEALVTPLLIREDEHSWQSLVTESQRFARTHEFDANFPVHRARRPPIQHDEKIE